MSLIIGLTGRSGAGKSTVANLICQLTGMHFEELAFATPLKEMCAFLFNVDLVYLSDQRYKNKPLYPGKIGDTRKITPKMVMQGLGTAVRDLDPDIFIRWVDLKLSKAIAKPNTNVIISDIRYQNEYNWVKGLGGYIIHIQRQESDNKPITHESENVLPISDWDLVICNDGSLQDLQQTIYLVMQSIIHPELEYTYGY